MITKVGSNVKIHYSVKAYGMNQIGSNSIILENVYLGYPDTETILKIGKEHLDFVHIEFKGCVLGNTVIIRSDSIIYCNVQIGSFVRTGHRVLIRENCIIGSNVLIGTNTIIENNCRIGNHVSIQSSVFIPSNTIIGDCVFIGPGVCMTNDKYPIRVKKDLYKGPVLEKGVSLGAASVILPGVTVGEGSMVASNSVVTKDVPKWHLAIGSPARFFPLKEELCKLNDII